jgi:acyl-CoA oxidase
MEVPEGLPNAPPPRAAAIQAHVEHVAYNAFQSAVDNCVDPDCRRALKALADLFALRCIEQDVIFRNDEYVAPAKVRDIDCLQHKPTF